MSNKNRSLIRTLWELTGDQSSNRTDWKQAAIPLEFDDLSDFKILIENKLLKDNHEGDTALVDTLRKQPNFGKTKFPTISVFQVLMI
jgi:hypothetical protein